MSGGSPSSTTQTTAPPAYVQPYLENLAKQASVLQSQGGLSQVADQNATQRQANTAALNYIYNPGTSDYLKNLQGANTNLLNAPDLNNNPYLPEYLKLQNQQITDAFNTNILPSIKGESVLTGGIGGSRQGVAEGLAAGKTAQAIAGSNADILNQAYLAGLSAQAKGLTLAPTTLSAPLSLYNAAGNVGQQQQQLEQLKLDAPAQGLQRLGELLGQSTGGGSTTTKTDQASSADTFNQTLGTFLSIASFFV